MLFSATSRPPAVQADETVTVLPNHGKIRRLQVLGVFDAGVEKLWEVVTSYDAYPTFMPRVKRFQVLERRPKQRVVDATLDFTVARMRYTLELTHDCEALRIEWRRLRGDFRHNSGFWCFTPLSDGRTQVEYRLDVDPGLPVPSWLSERLIARDLKGLFPALRKRCRC